MRGATGLAFVAVGLAGVALVIGQAPAPGSVSIRASGEGSFAISNSSDGSAIFTAANLAPGHSTDGSVTVGNTGSLPGTFTLSQADLADEPGPGGGLLSTRLNMAVTDVTAPAAPVTVYSGPLEALGTRPLGFFGPGEARTYNFAATLPDENGATDNPFAGSAASVRYVWTGESLPAGTLPPFRLRLHLPRGQSLLARGELIAYARCDKPCRLSVWARVQDPAGPSRFLRGHRRLPLASNRRTRLVLRLPAAPRNLLDRALRAGRPARVHVRFHASAESGEVVTVERVVAVRSATSRSRRSPGRPPPAPSTRRRGPTRPPS